MSRLQACQGLLAAHGDLVALGRPQVAAQQEAQHRHRRAVDRQVLQRLRQVLAACARVSLVLCYERSESSALGNDPACLQYLLWVESVCSKTGTVLGSGA